MLHGQQRGVKFLRQNPANGPSITIFGVKSGQVNSFGLLSDPDGLVPNQSSLARGVQIECLLGPRGDGTPSLSPKRPLFEA